VRIKAHRRRLVATILFVNPRLASLKASVVIRSPRAHPGRISFYRALLPLAAITAVAQKCMSVTTAVDAQLCACTTEG
jgi:hypothetical protein